MKYCEEGQIDINVKFDGMFEDSQQNKLYKIGFDIKMNRNLKIKEGPLMTLVNQNQNHHINNEDLLIKNYVEFFELI